jgi:phosphate starvation-inducible PhoH-like protein
LSLWHAIKLYNKVSDLKENEIVKIVYARANIGVSEERETGTLPGERIEKLMHLAYPILDNLTEIMGLGDAKALIEDEIIELTPIAEVRGRSFANCVVIVDEAQNISYSGLKTLLTRIGRNSRIALVGDSDQTDLRTDFWYWDAEEKRARVPFRVVSERLQGLRDVGAVRFTHDDIVRHPILADVLRRL